MKLRITILSGSAHYAPYLKLIECLRAAGAQVDVMAFERTWNPGPRLSASYETLGRIPIRGYARRIWPFVRALPRIRARARSAECLYVLGFDMRLLAGLALIGCRRRPITVYEVHDIRDQLVSRSRLGGWLRKLDRWLVRQSDRIVVTSQAYLDHYFGAELGLSGFPSFVLENKLDAARTPSPQPDPAIAIPPLRIGYFGSLRSKDSWCVLTRLAQSHSGRVEVYVRGVSNNLSTFDEDVTSIEAIQYCGPYANPADLPELYHRVDIVWIAGFNAKQGGGWARTCRFYESCFYGKPMIGQKGTEDGRVIAELGLGPVVDVREPESCIERIASIHSTELAAWRSSVDRLPRSVHTYVADHERLIDLLANDDPTSLR